MTDGNHTSSLVVVLGPKPLEIFNSLLRHWHVGHVGLAEERIDDDSNEKVEEHLRNDDLEEQMEGDCRTEATTSTGGIWVTRSEAVSDHGFVRLVLLALILKGVRLGRVKHNSVPCFTS